MTTVFESQGLAVVLRDVVSKYGNRHALCYENRTLTFEQIGRMVEQKIIVYGAKGIGSSSMVGVVADDPGEFLTDVLALLILRACAMLMPGDSTRWELEYLSGTVRLSHILSFKGMGFGGTILVGRRQLLIYPDCDRPSGNWRASVGYLTSGTTGRPRVAVRSEFAIVTEAISVGRELGLTPGQKMAIIVPLNHSFGFGVCGLTGILAGAELHYYRRMQPSAYLAAFQRANISMVPLVPAQLRLLAEACSEPVFRGLKLFSAGAPLDGFTARLTAERLGCPVGHIYGTSETGTIAVEQPGTTSVSGGTLCRHVEMRLDALPEEWESKKSEINAEGVVSIRSDALFDGYMHLDEIDGESIKSGWFSTGDCGRFVNGRLELSGRLSSAINVAGVKVSPEEIEAVLLEFPAVRMALVTGVKDDLAHQRIKAYVTPTDVDLKALRRFCQQRLSAAKCPHYYDTVENFVTTGSGKIVRTQVLNNEI